MLSDDLFFDAVDVINGRWFAFMMYKNQAGKMGAMSSQPAKRKMAANVDPLERLNQKMAGRTHGKSLEGLSWFA